MKIVLKITIYKKKKKLGNANSTFSPAKVPPFTKAKDTAKRHPRNIRKYKFSCRTGVVP